MRIGTRESKLAMRQTEIFAEKLKSVFPDEPVEIVGMTSLGDIDQKSPLDQLMTVGAFVRELDDALLRGDIDVSVNSMKDIPTVLTDGVAIGAVLPRDAFEDVILPCRLEDLPEGAVVGTASVRRTALLKSVRPDIRTANLRGNIHTRLSKLDAGEFDAIILAKAGLDRMGIDREMHILDPDVFIPAPAQGTIAVECRSDDEYALSMLKKLDHRSTRVETGMERAIMRFMGAGCSSPVGVNVTSVEDGFRIRAVSFTYEGGPRRVDTVLPFCHVIDELIDIADYLTGKRCRE